MAETIPYPHRSMRMEVEYLPGDNVEWKITEAFGAALEWIGRGIQEKRIRPVKTVELSLDINYLNYAIEAKWEYLNDN